MSIVQSPPLETQRGEKYGSSFNVPSAIYILYWQCTGCIQFISITPLVPSCLLYNRDTDTMREILNFFVQPVPIQKATLITDERLLAR